MLRILLVCVLAAGAFADDDFPPVSLDGVPEADRALLSPILDDPTMVVPLGEKKVAASVGIYEFLLARLDFTAKIVNEFRLGEYDIREMGPATFHVDDGSGAVADVRLVHETKDEAGKVRRLYLARGYFEIFGDLRVYGDGIIVLDYESDAAGHLVTDAVIYFKVKNDTIDKLSRLAERALRIVVKSKAALFVDAAKDASELIAKDAVRVSRRLERVEGVDEADLEAYREAFLPR